MAKREDTDAVILENNDRPRASREGRRKSAPPSVISRRKIAGWSLFVTVVLLSSLYVLYSFERFLIRDERFALVTAGDGESAATLQISGVRQASLQAVESVFAADSGRSIYTLSMNDRRVALQSIDWVKDASVARVWPNRTLVKIIERKPVAFVMSADRRTSFIDDDGVILPSSSAANFHLPVLKGVRAKDTPQQRRAGVARMHEVLTAMGPHAEKISSVNVADLSDVEVTLPHDGRMVTLEMGNGNFVARFDSFLNYYSSVKANYPQATRFDLREDGRITGSLQ